MAEMMKDAVLGSLWHWCQWFAGLVFNLIGWPGILAGVAGFLLLLSLSAKAVKFLNSPRGMGTTAAVLVVCLGLVWWGWPKQAAAKPVRELASYEPNVRRSDRPVPKLQAVASPPIVAMKTPPPVAEKPAPEFSETAWLAFATPLPPPAPVISLPAVPIPQLKPAVPQRSHRPQHHAPARHPQMGQGHYQTGFYVQRQAAQHARAMQQQYLMMEREVNNMMHHFGGGSHIGGMHGGGHMGGMHGGGHAGGMRGGMGHLGGHH